MLVRRMSQTNRSEQERKAKEAASAAARERDSATRAATLELEQELAKKDTAMLDLQRRVEGE